MEKLEMTFEDALKKLEELSSKMETGKLTLNESIGAYEESMGLIDYCNRILDKAEQRVNILRKNENDAPVEEPFESD